MDIKSLGVVGSSGKFGTFLIDRVLEQKPDLTIFRNDPADQKSCSLNELAGADAIVFSVPPQLYESTLRDIVPRTKPGTLIIDICTVKVHTVKVLREVVHTRPYIATHPMFGPQSYLDQGKSLKGLDIIICDKSMQEGDYLALEYFLKNNLQLKVTTMTPKKHDKMQAIYQLLPQRIGSVVNRAGFKMEDGAVYTLSGQHFFRAMEIVKYDEQLFRQVSRLNPYWRQVWQRFLAAESELDLEMVNADMAELDLFEDEEDEIAA